ncbi:MAG TPA: GNAT family N-acetyltransferase, partial [Acidimicrobiales bacterium]
GDNIFGTGEWLSTWWRHFGRGRPLHVIGARRPDGQLAAIIPLYEAARRPLRMIRFVGHGATDQLGPVCAVDARSTAAAALGGLFAPGASPFRWDLALADELPGDTQWPGTRLARRPSWVATLAGRTGAEWSAGLSPKLRYQLAVGARRLAERGPVRYRNTSHAGEVAADLDRFLALHEVRWAGVGGSRSFAGRREFHHDFAAQAFARGWLRLHFLEVDGEAVAALYNVRFAGVESTYQASRDPAFDRCSVGLLLNAHAIRSAADDGLCDYRFLRGDEPYKRRFADRDAGLQTVAWTNGRVGDLALGVVRHVPSLSRKARRRVPAPYAWDTGGSPRWSRP